MENIKMATNGTASNINAPQDAGFLSKVKSNILDLFDDGVKVYDQITTRIGLSKAAKASTTSTQPPQQTTILGLDSKTAMTYGAIAVGVLVLVMVIKKK